MGEAKAKFTRAKIDSMFRLGYKLAFDSGSQKKKWNDIFALWHCAATNGHLRAQFYIGTCYDFGKGVKKNVSEAFNWYMKAAKGGKMEAQYNVGFFYKEGELVKQDYKKAVYWYLRAAKQGDTEAQRDLGFCYFYGQGVKQDPLKAIYWYKKAAEKNDDKANYNLGLCFEFGDGVTQSNRWAKHYFLKSEQTRKQKSHKQIKAIVIGCIKYCLVIFSLIFTSCEKSKDPVDESDRLDFTNTVDTTRGTYHPKIDTTYFFPGDSSDLVSEYKIGEYKIKTILFPVRYKYVILFLENAGSRAKIKYRDYKLQIEISNDKGLFIKKVITKYDFFKPVLGTDKNYYFIRAVRFNGFANEEFRFDLKVSESDVDEPTWKIKSYVPLIGEVRFENYPKTYYDSLRYLDSLRTY